MCDERCVVMAFSCGADVADVEPCAAAEGEGFCGAGVEEVPSWGEVADSVEVGG